MGDIRYLKKMGSQVSRNSKDEKVVSKDEVKDNQGDSRPKPLGQKSEKFSNPKTSPAMFVEKKEESLYKRYVN